MCYVALERSREVKSSFKDCLAAALITSSHLYLQAIAYTARSSASGYWRKFPWSWNYELYFAL